MDEPPQKAEDTWLAQGDYAAFFQRNRAGIQYVDTERGIYYVSRRHQIRGPIPAGVTIQHTGLASAATTPQQRPVVRKRSGG